MKTRKFGTLFMRDPGSDPDRGKNHAEKDRSSREEQFLLSVLLLSMVQKTYERQRKYRTKAIIIQESKTKHHALTSRGGP